jgi:hypothetical protein
MDTAAPDWVTVPLPALVIFWSPGNVKASVQPLTVCVRFSYFLVTRRR